MHLLLESLVKADFPALFAGRLTPYRDGPPTLAIHNGWASVLRRLCVAMDRMPLVHALSTHRVRGAALSNAAAPCKSAS